jgi:hypothetical protein
MARIRTIKPSFFKNELIAELQMTTRLLFIGLWTLADREGRLEDRPKRIKAEVFPYDNVDVDDQLSRLQSAGFILRYSPEAITELSEMKVIQIINFTKHQRITGSEADTESEYPECDQASTRKQLGNTLVTPRTTGREGKGKERSIVYPTLEEFTEYCRLKGFEGIAKKAYEYYSEADWKDSKGNKVRNWKQKLQGVWFKPENKTSKQEGGMIY